MGYGSYSTASKPKQYFSLAALAILVRSRTIDLVRVNLPRSFVFSERRSILI